MWSIPIYQGSTSESWLLALSYGFLRSSQLFLVPLVASRTRTVPGRFNQQRPRTITFADERILRHRIKETLSTPFKIFNVLHVRSEPDAYFPHRNHCPYRVMRRRSLMSLHDDKLTAVMISTSRIRPTQRFLTDPLPARFGLTYVKWQ